MIWSITVAVLWISGYGDAQLESIHDPGLHSALVWLLRMVDPFWIFLAAVNVYLELCRTAGIATARRTAFAILALLWLAAFAATRLDYIRFTDRLGPAWAGVPLAFLFLWFSLIEAAKSLARSTLIRASLAQTGAVALVLLAVANANIERVAWNVRAWWLWHPHSFHQGHSSFFAGIALWAPAGIAGLFLIRGAKVETAPSKPVISLSSGVFLVLNAVLLLGRLAH